MIKAHINSQRLRRHARGLHGTASGLLCVYYGFQFSFFTGFLSVPMSEFLFPYILLGSFSFACLFCPITMCQFLFYLVIFYSYSLAACQSTYGRKGADTDGRGGEEQPEGREWEEIVIGTCYLRERSIVNKKKKEKNK